MATSGDPLRAEGVRTKEGTSGSDREGPLSCGPCGASRGEGSDRGRALAAPGAQLRPFPRGGARSSRYSAVGVAVVGDLGNEQLDAGLGEGCSDLCGGSVLGYQDVSDR
jgi:hypothetical protein